MKSPDQLLRDKARHIQQAPDAHVWMRIENKLLKEDHRKRMRSQWVTRWISGIAAVFIFVAVFIQWNDILPSPAQTSEGTIASWEELEIVNDDFYNVQRVHNIHLAYARIGGN